MAAAAPSTSPTASPAAVPTAAEAQPTETVNVINEAMQVDVPDFVYDGDRSRTNEAILESFYNHGKDYGPADFAVA